MPSRCLGLDDFGRVADRSGVGRDVFDDHAPGTNHRPLPDGFALDQVCPGADETARFKPVVAGDMHPGGDGDAVFENRIMSYRAVQVEVHVVADGDVVGQDAPGCDD